LGRALQTRRFSDHSYGDHASLLKFIERNWNLQPLTNRSRDNLPNPEVNESNLYVQTNMPALDDLWDAFHFDRKPNLQRYIDVRLRGGYRYPRLSLSGSRC
jgi:phospholipase C